MRVFDSPKILFKFQLVLTILFSIYLLSSIIFVYNGPYEIHIGGIRVHATEIEKLLTVTSAPLFLLLLISPTGAFLDKHRILYNHIAGYRAFRTAIPFIRTTILMILAVCLCMSFWKIWAGSFSFELLGVSISSAANDKEIANICALIVLTIIFISPDDLRRYLYFITDPRINFTRIIGASVVTLLFIATILILSSMYHARAFAFHDLTLINDWMSNAIYYGNPFFIDDGNFNHIKVHLTFSLILLAPLYYIFDSQFILVALTVGSFFISLLFVILITERLLKVDDNSNINRVAIAVITGGLVVILGWSPYARTAMSYPHYELFLPPLAMWLFWGVITNRSWWSILIPFILLLGLRQDAGFYLFFHIIILMLAPKSLFDNHRVALKRSAWLSAGCVLYTIIAMKGLLPYLGGNAGVRYWSHWGSNWGEVFHTMITNPTRLFESLENSGFWNVNKSFFFLHIASPITALIANVQAVLLFTSKPPDHNMVMYYNSAFLLPGYFLSFLYGFRRLFLLFSRATGALTSWSKVINPNVVHSIPAFIVIYLCSMTFNQWMIAPSFLPVEWKIHRPAQDHNFQEILYSVLKACPNAKSVSTDFDSIVFVPNTHKRYRLHKYYLADAVAILHDYKASSYYIIGNDIAAVKEKTAMVAMNSDAYKVVTTNGNVSMLVKNDITCHDIFLRQ